MPKIMFRPNPVPPPFVPPVPISGGLIFIAQEANSFVAFNINGSVMGVSLLYSTDNGETWNPYTFGQSINLAAVNDYVMFKGDNNSFSVDDENYIQAEMNGKIAASGSLTYLLNSDGENKTLTPYCFAMLFNGCTSLSQAPALPATFLDEGCYQEMFKGCTSLVQAPALPATILQPWSYFGMFKGCTSLVQAPTLPATTLESHCYQEMFKGCTSLVQAPILPATILKDSCYYEMFNGCISLTQVPELNATTLAPYCYYSMFANCTSLIQAPTLPATILEISCYKQMFKGCTSLVKAPSLPAISLPGSCYQEMFEGCASLNYIQCNATVISANLCLQDWLANVSASGTFKKNPLMNDWPSGANGIPNGWTVEDI